MATLLHMVDHAQGSHSVVVWHWAVSRADQTKSDRTGVPAKQKLRVWWGKQSSDWAGGFIPKNKSISRPSCIIDTALYQKTHQAIETLALGKTSFRYHIEAIPLRLSGKSCVLSLLKIDASLP